MPRSVPAIRSCVRTGLETCNTERSKFHLVYNRCRILLTLHLLYRYANMDFILFSGLKGANIDHIRISYDIMCQWCKRLPGRMEKFPEALQLPADTSLSFGIPKFHLEGHGPACRTKFSFNYLPGSGRTCGEMVETEWSFINPVATSTKEMAPCARQETLNDHWSFWNWRKTTGFGTCVYARYYVS